MVLWSGPESGSSESASNQHRYRHRHRGWVEGVAQAEKLLKRTAKTAAVTEGRCDCYVRFTKLKPCLKTKICDIPRGYGRDAGRHKYILRYSSIIAYGTSFLLQLVGSKFAIAIAADNSALLYRVSQHLIYLLAGRFYWTFLFEHFYFAEHILKRTRGHTKEFLYPLK